MLKVKPSPHPSPMRRGSKVLIIGSICLVVVLGIVIAIAKSSFVVMEGKYGKETVFDPNSILIALPAKIANVVIPPPKLERKEPEERKRIVIKYLKEMADAEERWQLKKRLEIEKRILKMGDPILPALIDVIRDPEEEKRWCSIRYEAHAVLIDIVRWKTIPADEIIDEDWKKAWYEGAIKLAKRIDVEGAVPGLIEVACRKKEDNKSRNYALDILGKLKDKRAVEPLISIAREGWGIDTLGEIGDERAVDVLIWVIEKEKGKVYPQGVWTKWEQGIKALGQIGGKESIDVLMRLFKENPEDKKIIEALGLAKATEAVPMLIEMLEEERNLDNRCNIITVLGEIGAKEAVDALIYLLIHLKEDSYRGGGVLIKALGKTGDERAVEPLESFLNDQYVADWAAEALKKITGKEYKYKE